MDLVLASSSPRRRALLLAAGIPHRVFPVSVDEDVPPALAPSEAVRLLAERKARAAAAQGVRGRILGADTMVVLDGRVLGKPRDPEDARRTLVLLSGREHDVYTGICLLDTAAGTARTAVERSRVSFRRLSPAEIDAYVASGEPLDKAGAYGIQGAAAEFVAEVAGPRDNVVGLPVARVLELLGVDP